MRATLAISIVCLGITLALNHWRVLFPVPVGDPPLADSALEILVGAKGPLLPVPLLGGGREQLGEVIRFGDRTLVAPGRSGLRAAVLASGFGLRLERCFDVASSDMAISRDEVRALDETLEAVIPGEVLVLASSGRIEPLEEEARDELARALSRPGPRARPGTATPESWALVAVKLEDGWVPLAEGYSRDAGVALAFVLSPDLDTYSGFHGDFALVRAGERSEVDLEAELEHATLHTAGVQRARPAIVQGQPMTGIRLPPDARAGGPGRLVWSGIPLGPGSWLVVGLGLEDGTSAGSDGVAVEVRVDGELVNIAGGGVSRRVVQPGARWKVLQLHLGAFAGKRVDLEIDVDPLQGSDGDSLLLGWPRLLHGYSRPPNQVWMEER